MDDLELIPEEKEALAEIRKKKTFLIQEQRMKKITAESRPIVQRKFDKDRKFTSERLGKELSSLGLDPSAAINWARSLLRGQKRQRSWRGDMMEVMLWMLIVNILTRSCMWCLDLNQGRSHATGRTCPGRWIQGLCSEDWAIKLFKKPNGVKPFKVLIYAFPQMHYARGIMIRSKPPAADRFFL
ncbi:hypothetical protein Nepgr_017879 [Nepenthes gracilis]|uniref:Uncharacterized protein n=1 Tax=Nepenthes gracilis TaxID=150966 RepID=A0AAD3SQ77_NEPGR|nr:hypothetical protein Nepgr_017879 [Nepenthes gracilis]